MIGLKKQSHKFKFTKKGIDNLFQQLNISQEDLPKPETNNLQKSTNSYHKDSEWHEDFHGLILKEVKLWLFSDMIAYFKVGYATFTLVHGFNKGAKIRNYLRGNFKNDFSGKFPKLKIIVQISKKGTTRVLIESRK